MDSKAFESQENCCELTQKLLKAKRTVEVGLNISGKSRESLKVDSKASESQEIPWNWTQGPRKIEKFYEIVFKSLESQKYSIKRTQKL